RGSVVRGFTSDSINDTYAFRALVEGYVAGLAAQHASKAEIRKMRETANGMDEEVQLALKQRAGSRERAAQFLNIAKCNQDFHQSVLVASDSTRAVLLLRNLVEIPLVYKAFSWYTEE